MTQLKRVQLADLADYCRQNNMPTARVFLTSAGLYLENCPMPNDDRYPADWPLIAARIKIAANWCCEHCQHPHEPQGYVLTVHHIDGNPANCSDTNLVALCQRCHLHWQARYTPGQTIFPHLRPDWMQKRGLG